jgi:predicted DNA-binding mobile mystery protein A
MKIDKQKLIIEQVDGTLKAFRPLETIVVPENGWINAVRTALKMSLKQFAKRLGITPQSVKEIEQREANGTITLKNLTEAAKVLELKLVYGFIPKEDSLEKMIERRAHEIAIEIVQRTSLSMKLEAQGNSEERIRKNIERKKAEIINTLPKYIWD